MKRSLINFLPEHASEGPVSFHMPGHKGSQLYKELGYGYILDHLMDFDITEIPGADNLFQTEDVIFSIMQKYGRLYGSRKSYLLVNGSSVGLITAILSSSKRGDKVILARNSHKSIFNALTLGGLEPVYLYPEILGDHGILGSISADEVSRLIDENPEASCVVLPSPNYYGICSDIKAIADVCHGSGKILIVDQAHGAHLKFIGEGYPKAAEDCGADIVINSIHKTLASWTQTALMNVMTDRVDLASVEDYLQILESSSPSYPLMLSLDVNADILLDPAKGPETLDRWKKAVDLFYSEASGIKGLRVIKDPMLDRTKLNLDTGAWGITGNQLEEMLMKRGIYVELVTGNITMCMTGIGTTEEHIRRLLKALNEICSEQGDFRKGAVPEDHTAMLTIRLERTGVPESKVSMPVMDCAGRVCAASIIPYPPGIPLACPGEILTEEVLEYISDLRSMGEKVIGVSEKGEILVGE